MLSHKIRCSLCRVPENQCTEARTLKRVDAEDADLRDASSSVPVGEHERHAVAKKDLSFDG